MWIMYVCLWVFRLWSSSSVHSHRRWAHTETHTTHGDKKNIRASSTHTNTHTRTYAAGEVRGGRLWPLPEPRLQEPPPPPHSNLRSVSVCVCVLCTYVRVVWCGVYTRVCLKRMHASCPMLDPHIHTRTHMHIRVHTHARAFTPTAHNAQLTAHSPHTHPH